MKEIDLQIVCSSFELIDLEARRRRDKSRMMTKSRTIILCLLSLLGFAHCEETLKVEGTVYCDSCRIQFITRISEFIQGAKVRLECRDREGGSITYSKEAETEEQGRYHIEVEGDHEEEVCEVVLVSSPNAECSDISHDSFSRVSARISLTNNNGIAGPVRIPNPLGFLRKDPLPHCPQVLKELGLTPDGNLA